MQEILSFQFPAYKKEISCRDFFSKKLRAKQRNLVRRNSQSNERAVQDTSLVATEFSTYGKRHANLLQSMSSSEKFSKDAKVEDFKK